MLRGFNQDGSYVRTHSAEDYKSILKLEKKLVERKIPHVFHEFMDGWQVIYYTSEGERVGDVIEHCGSYDLEAMGFGLLDVQGWLTVEEALWMFEEAYREDMAKHEKV